MRHARKKNQSRQRNIDRPAHDIQRVETLGDINAGLVALVSL
jgi:hypothetical protein